MAKSIIDAIGRERAYKLMDDAMGKAAADTKKLGLPEPVKIDGIWYREFPDGHKEPIKIGSATEPKKMLNFGIG
ncbi:MAG: hypothetical protein IT497_00180 [Ottowia sp.]|nr:hypothetical protein [Ottowia sp.]